MLKNEVKPRQSVKKRPRKAKGTTLADVEKAVKRLEKEGVIVKDGYFVKC